MQLPEGFTNGPGDTRVWKLKKTLYGLKQAPREWYKVLSKGLQLLGFTQSEHDQALWHGMFCGARVVLLHWVDDLLLAGPDLRALQRCKELILAKFKGRDLGEATAYLGMMIQRDRKARTLTLSQPTRVADLLERFRMGECTPRPIPMAAGADYSKTRAEPTGNRPADVLFDRTTFMECVGSLLYLATTTRPDIAAATSMLARSMNNPSKRHWHLAKQVLAYLAGTPDLGITYRGGDDFTFHCYTDADFAGCEDTRKSRSGYAFILAGGAVCWQSKLQTVVTTSTTESEYLAGSAGSKVAVWIRRVGTELDGQDMGPLRLECDNRSMLHMAVNSADSSRTKHVDIQYHYLRQAVARGQVTVVHVGTDANIADVFTKPLAAEKFLRFRRGLGMP